MNAASFRRMGVLCLATAMLLSFWMTAGREIDRHVAMPGIGRHRCPPRTITYCVCPWSRDPWNVRSRWAIGQAARSWNSISRYRFKEVWCNAEPYLPIFFEKGPHGDGHEFAPFDEGLLAHATYPERDHQFVHVNDETPWRQAQDSLGRGFDLASTMGHEFGHALGLEHLTDAPGTLMQPYRYQRLPGFSDEERLRSIENRCLDPDEHDPIEVLSPGPGETWYPGYTYRISWRSELPGPLRLGIYREGRLIWWLTTEATPSGTYDVRTNTGWPLGPAYEACVSTVDGGTMGCSDMFLVAPR